MKFARFGSFLFLISLCLHAGVSFDMKFPFDRGIPTGIKFSLLFPEVYKKGLYTGIKLRYWAFYTVQDSTLMEGTLTVEGCLKRAHRRYYMRNLTLVDMTGTYPQNEKALLMEILKEYLGK